MILAVTCTQVLLLVQVLARIVLVVPAVLSRRVAVAQSNCTVSGQCTWYQKLSVVVPLAAVKVCAMELLPLVGELEPASAEKLPLCAVVLIEVVPLLVQPVKFPVSKPPLTMLFPPPVPVTVTATEVL